jgi:hypothetical protein
MSSRNPEERRNPENHLTPTEIDHRNRLEAMAQHGLGAYLLVGGVLAEIRDRQLYRDSHRSFEAYLRERWAVNAPNVELPPQTTASTEETCGAPLEPRAAHGSTSCEDLARACEQTLAALNGDERVSIEIHVDVRHEADLGAPDDEPVYHVSRISEPAGDAVLPNLRWLLAQASGTIGLIAHRLESRAADIDDEAREQLRDDLVMLEDDLATVKALLLELVDWDLELGRLLIDEVPPFDEFPPRDEVDESDDY